MASAIEKKDHVWPNFKWDKKPSCQCGQLIKAVERKFIFVANISDGEGEQKSNFFYMMPTDADGDIAKSKGVQIAYCPWCGDKVIGRKKYPLK